MDEVIHYNKMSYCCAYTCAACKIFCYMVSSIFLVFSPIIISLHREIIFWQYASLVLVTNPHPTHTRYDDDDDDDGDDGNGGDYDHCS